MCWSWCSGYPLPLTFYRAYEIKTIYGQEPPPVSILEKLTAKGGDVRTRTVDNFDIPPTRTSLANGASDSEEEGSKTPKEEKMEIDDPGSGSGRVTRGMLTDILIHFALA